MFNSHRPKGRVNRWKCFIASLCTSWECFTEASSFHGLKYISSERKIYQKFVWLICMLASFTCLVILSYYLYFHYMAAPTKTIVRTQHYPSVLIPFPALTVCPPNKISARKTNSFLRPFYQRYQHATNTPSDEKAILRAISQLNDPLESNLASDQDMEQLDKIFEFGNFSISDFITEMSVECNEWIVKCIWNYKNIPCKEIFHNVLTSQGYCCSFNYEGVYLKKYQSIYSSGFGLHSGLSIVLRDDSPKIQSSQNYFHVIVHDPLTFPENIRTTYLISKFKETALALRIIYNLADYRLRELSPKSRDCVFREEYLMKYFEEYRFENCLTDCQLRHLYEACGCIPHYFPAVDRKVCKPMDILCIKQHSTQVVVQESGNGSTACICPNECDMFLIKTSLTEWKFYPMNETEVELYKGLTNHSTILHIFLGQSHNHLYNRVVSLRALNFTSNIGGLVALFLGSSLISILELSYYFTCRLYRTYARIRADTKVLYKTKLYLEFNKTSKF